VKDRSADVFNAGVTGVGDPHDERRDYVIGKGRALVGLLDNPWYPPYVTDTPHIHNVMEIGVCLSGEGEIRMGGSAWLFRVGTVVVAPRGVPHAQDNRGVPMTHWRYVLVDIEQYLADVPDRYRVAASKSLSGMPGGVYTGDGMAADSAAQTIEAMFRRHEQCGTYEDLELDALLRLLLAQIMRMPGDIPQPQKTPKARQLIEPSLRYVSDNYPGVIRVEDMAACCAMSESHFRKVFARIMGVAPLEYVNSYRINRAIYLLYSTEESVAFVAEQCGFTSIATFNRNFKRFTGATPAHWRKAAHV